MFRKVLFATGFFVFATLSALAQSITIEGVTDRSTYTDVANFRVVTNAGFSYGVTLNGAPVPAGVTNRVTRMDYYDLAVSRTNDTSSAVSTGLVRFIVLSSQRGSPEKGLIQWLPYPSIPATASEFAGAHLRLIAPSNYPKGFEIPVVAWVEDAQGNERRANGFVTAAGFETARIKILRGVGSGFIPAQSSAGPLNYDAQLHAMSAPKVINVDSNTTWTTVAGTLAGSTAWPDNARIWINGHVTIPQGSSLTVGAGSVVRLNPLVNITNLGRIEINGTSNQPVVFTSAGHVLPEDSGTAWGGFVMRTNTSELVANYTIFNGAGGANSWSFSPGSSHKSQQPVLFVQFGAHVWMTNSAIINTHGQVGNGYRAVMTLDHCLYQRAITSGEYDTCTNVYNHCALIEFPEENGTVDATIADADYDAIYMIKGTNLFLNTLVGFSKDDAIDSGSDGSGDPLGSVRVDHCWIESALHESMAWSGHNRKTWAYNTVSMNSGQGIENGWTDGSSSYANALVTPDCFADGLLSTANSVGARVGDNYNWAYRGFLRLTNSLVLYNYRNVFLKTWNTSGVLWDTNSWVDRLGQIDLANSALSAADARFPAQPIWNPAADGPRLAQWMTTPPDAPVGIGFALWDALSAGDLTNGIPVRLSSFTTNLVSVDYAFETEEATVATGTLNFTPGETVKRIYGNSTALGGATTWRVVLRNPMHGEITGTAAAYVFPAQPGTTPTTLIANGSVWKYLDDGSNQGTAWRAINFADNTWSNGPAQLGFGDNDEATRIRRTNDMTAGQTITTFYFRHAFTVNDPALSGNLSMWMLRDDGAVVYLNGTEVFRSPSMPPVPTVITYTTFANNQGSAPPDNTIDTATLSAAPLVAGTNVVAVEVHQFDPPSSDLSFDFSLTANPAAAPARLSMTRFGADLALHWSEQGYVLESSDQVTGPWSVAAEQSPASVSLGSPQKFFRLRKP